MIHPAPTTKIAPGLARATFREAIPATATRPAHVRLGFANTSYDLHLLPTSPVKAEPGDKVFGTIQARARRIDPVPSGGMYVEPVIGRPRRVQGRIVGHGSDTIIVDAGVPFHCTLTDDRQHAQDFKVGDMVTFAVLDGASFTPKAES
ncbi:MAG: hypothetical protein ACIAS6_04395 [Phycisphaerales bacterium JB060]